MRIAYVSSFPPRECGIATFAEDLIEAIDKYNTLASGVVVAVNDAGSKYDYSERVRVQIERDSIRSYLDAASWINHSNIDVVSLQHEFGLFGGANGEYIIPFLEELKKPIVSTLHTIPYLDCSNEKKILNRIACLNDSLVVIGSNAAHILRDEYKIENKIHVVPHGCPDVPYVDRDTVKASLGLRNRTILSTFGFVSSRKGIEYIINALPSIVKVDPRVVYVVIGETHPQNRKKEGEKYRQVLSSLVDNLGLRGHVTFIDRFLTKKELISYLQATDIYVASSITRDQVSSGTLAYASGAGKAIISTPFPHAQELLSDGRGLLCEFEDSDSIAKCAITLLKDKNLREEMEKRVYHHCKQYLWPEVARKYIKLFKETARHNTNS